MNEFETLLAILRETLNDVEGRIETTRKAIEDSQSKMEIKEEELAEAESQKMAAARADEQAAQKVEVLCEHLKTLERPPAALMMKMRELMERRQHAATDLRGAEGKVESTRHDLTSRQQKLEEKEKTLDTLQKDWNAISGMAANARTKAKP